MNENSLEAARDALLEWMAKQIVAELLAEAIQKNQNASHENRDLHPLLDRQAAGNLPR